MAMKNANLEMPDVLSSLIQDFIRPNPFKKDWDAVEAQMRELGEDARFSGKDSDAWGAWVNRFTDDEWDLMVSNNIAPPWLIEVEGDYIQQEFLGMTRAQEMLQMAADY